VDRASHSKELLDPPKVPCFDEALPRRAVDAGARSWPSPPSIVPWGLVALAPLVSGCIGLPFGLPPTQVTVAGGPSKAAGEESSPTLQIRAAVHPLQFAPQWTSRSVDFGAGYMFDSSRSYTLHGGYAEGGAVLFRRQGDTTFFRLSARGQVRLIKEPTLPLMGRGAAALLVLEAGAFQDGPFSTVDHRGGAIGYAYGESSIGLSSELSYTSVDRLEAWALTFGVVVRMPTLLGFAYVWAWEALRK
jgi:hypothetical protein